MFDGEGGERTQDHLYTNCNIVVTLFTILIERGKKGKFGWEKYFDDA